MLGKRVSWSSRYFKLSSTSSGNGGAIALATGKLMKLLIVAATKRPRTTTNNFCVALQSLPKERRCALLRLVAPTDEKGMATDTVMVGNRRSEQRVAKLYSTWDLQWNVQRCEESALRNIVVKRHSA